MQEESQDVKVIKKEKDAEDGKNIADEKKTTDETYSNKKDDKDETGEEKTMADPFFAERE